MTANPAVTHRRCSRCGRILPAAAYHRGNKNGWCKDCKSAWAKQDYRRKADKYGAASVRVCPRCNRELPASAFGIGQHYCRTCKNIQNAQYYARHRKPTPSKPQPEPKPPAPPAKPEPVHTSNTHAIIRTPGRIPVLYGCKMGGEHACYISDGVVTGPTCRHVIDAIAGWNAL